LTTLESETWAQPVRLTGFDSDGESFRSGKRILRGIYPGHADRVRQVLGICASNDLFSRGIIGTSELASNPFPELGYEMVLEHERVEFVTYPHEWSASMFRDAALFHVDLFEQLSSHGLTLKDWHPYNVLFRGTKPVFVDFTSIVPIGSLESEAHLSINRPARRFDRMWDGTARAIYEMYSTMFEPFFGLPLQMMHRGRHALARKRLAETALNTSRNAMTRKEAFEGSPFGRLWYEFTDRRLRTALTEKGADKKKFFDAVRRRVEKLNVAVTGSAYATYYEDKGEAFSREPQPEWTNKQRVVNDALSRFKPGSVLDLGSNAGWFSMLAATHGCSVVAVDLDEASIDRLYSTARREGLSVIPLVVNLAAPIPERFALKFEKEPSLSAIGSDEPVVSSPVKRLRCDMTLALAIVHHLALGQGMSFEQIAKLFDALSRDQVCVEFVDMQDRMITSEPEFFPAYNASRDSYGWYTRENFIAALKKHFGLVEVLPSHPETRSMLICSRQA
jgi:SAM-dependent methyltransferase